MNIIKIIQHILPKNKHFLLSFSFGVYFSKDHRLGLQSSYKYQRWWAGHRAQPLGTRTPTDIFNHSILHNTIPNIWKIGKIITILKPNKSPTEPASYRPISLLCNPLKILERLVQWGFVRF